MLLKVRLPRNAGVRIIRDGIVLFEGELDTLKRFKDDAKEVAQGYECGITIENSMILKKATLSKHSKWLKSKDKT